MIKRILITFLFLFLILMQEGYTQTDAPKDDPALAAFELDTFLTELKSTGRPWKTIMDGENVLTGLYVLKAGTEDRQNPHDTDEVYYVTSGKAKFIAGEETVEVKTGSIIFVKAEIPHRFFDIEEDLVLVVFFDK